MKLTHKKKVKLARKMRTKEEIREKKNLFDSKEWTKRKEARRIKSLKREFPEIKEKTKKQSPSSVKNSEASKFLVKEKK